MRTSVPILFFLSSLFPFSLAELTEWAPDLRIVIMPLEDDKSAPSQGAEYGRYGYGRGWAIAADHQQRADDPEGQSGACHWVPLGEWSACTDTCGGCGRRWRARECRRRDANCTDDCTCTGANEREEEACNLQVCLYPRAPCCDGRVPGSVDRQFACVYRSLDPGSVL